MAANALPSEGGGGGSLLSVGKYRLGDRLGVGSYGAVSLAVDRSGAAFAIKSVDTSRVDDTAAVERTSREFYILTSLNHKNVIRLHEVFHEGGRLFLVMELAGHGDLDALLKRQEGGLLPEARCRSIFSQIVAAVRYCHRHHVAHRDLKAENVLLMADDTVKVADFGLSSTVVEGGDRRPGTPVGTPLYAAPEVLNQRRYPHLGTGRPPGGDGGPVPSAGTQSAAAAAAAAAAATPSGIPGEAYSANMADVWSCGVVLWRMAFGALPFPADTMRELRAAVFEPLVVPPSAPAALRALLAAMLHTDPWQRPTAEELAHHPWLGQDEGGGGTGGLPELPDAPPLADPVPVGGGESVIAAAEHKPVAATPGSTEGDAGGGPRPHLPAANTEDDAVASAASVTPAVPPQSPHRTASDPATPQCTASPPPATPLPLVPGVSGDPVTLLDGIAVRGRIAVYEPWGATTGHEAAAPCRPRAGSGCDVPHATAFPGHLGVQQPHTLLVAAATPRRASPLPVVDTPCGSGCVVAIGDGIASRLRYRPASTSAARQRAGTGSFEFDARPAATVTPPASVVSMSHFGAPPPPMLGTALSSPQDTAAATSTWAVTIAASSAGAALRIRAPPTAVYAAAAAAAPAAADVACGYPALSPSSSAAPALAAADASALSSSVPRLLLRPGTSDSSWCSPLRPCAPAGVTGEPSQSTDGCACGGGATMVASFGRLRAIGRAFTAPRAAALPVTPETARHACESEGAAEFAVSQFGNGEGGCGACGATAAVAATGERPVTSELDVSMPPHPIVPFTPYTEKGRTNVPPVILGSSGSSGIMMGGGYGGGGPPLPPCSSSGSDAKGGDVATAATAAVGCDAPGLSALRRVSRGAVHTELGPVVGQGAVAVTESRPGGVYRMNRSPDRLRERAVLSAAAAPSPLPLPRPQLRGSYEPPQSLQAAPGQLLRQAPSHHVVSGPAAAAPVGDAGAAAAGRPVDVRPPAAAPAAATPLQLLRPTDDEAPPSLRAVPPQRATTTTATQAAASARPSGARRATGNRAESQSRVRQQQHQPARASVVRRSSIAPIVTAATALRGGPSHPGLTTTGTTLRRGSGGGAASAAGAAVRRGAPPERGRCDGGAASTSPEEVKKARALLRSSAAAAAAPAAAARTMPLPAVTARPASGAPRFHALGAERRAAAAAAAIRGAAQLPVPLPPLPHARSCGSVTAVEVALAAPVPACPNAAAAAVPARPLLQVDATPPLSALPAPQPPAPPPPRDVPPVPAGAAALRPPPWPLPSTPPPSSPACCESATGGVQLPPIRVSRGSRAGSDVVAASPTPCAAASSVRRSSSFATF